MREILGGGIPTGGICKITYRAREIEQDHFEEKIRILFNRLSDEDKVKINNEISKIKKSIMAGITPSLCTTMISQLEYCKIIDKYENIYRHS